MDWVFYAIPFKSMENNHLKYSNTLFLSIL